MAGCTIDLYLQLNTHEGQTANGVAHVADMWPSVGHTSVYTLMLNLDIPDSE
jgi:hypothetical protein